MRASLSQRWRSLGRNPSKSGSSAGLCPWLRNAMNPCRVSTGPHHASHRSFESTSVTRAPNIFSSSDFDLQPSRFPNAIARAPSPILPVSSARFAAASPSGPCP